MQQLLIFVGPDVCGKSHIAAELSHRLKIPIYKASSEHKNFLNQQDNFLLNLQFADPARLDIVSQTKCSVIFDRGYPCEYVYSRFYNRKSDLYMLQYLDEAYASLGAKIIFCTRKSFVGIADDLDPRLNQVALENISTLYEEYLKTIKCDYYKLFVDDQDLNREVGEILNFLNKSDTNIHSDDVESVLI